MIETKSSFGNNLDKNENVLKNEASIIAKGYNQPMQRAPKDKNYFDFVDGSISLPTRFDPNFKA